MALHLGQTVSDGIGRVLTRTGGVLLAALVAIQLLIQASINTAVVGFFPPGPAGELEAYLGVTLPVSGTVAGGLLAAGVVLASAYVVAVSRALTRPRRELATFPSELYTRRIGRATLTTLVGGIVVGIAVTIGTALFFFPGVFLSTCFIFFMFAVGVEDRGVVGALKRSWALSRGNRLRLALIVVVAAVFGLVLGVVGSVFDIANEPLVAELVTNTLGGVLFVFLYGVTAEAYLRVRDDGGDGESGPVTVDSTDSATASAESMDRL
jgi:hypothetical protein